ncbi:DUF2093 domain-containing protein [Zavarzinia sp. CC-PAN008]|uniref:DUF2093 domain-containing protein n=1 Tax=Zavarzinia sp. CC-PAN008 TaxID=3243332 RepID=UPI003F746E30
MDSATNPARLRYEMGRFTVLWPGSHVVCAVTGQRIPLEALRYWSVPRQEPYASAEIADKARQAD